MNNVDKQYLDLLRDILDNGTFKKTRAGDVLSVFGRQMRFNLQDGLPLLTTKKMFTKGIITELLWFLKGETNIKFLVENNVHIWDDDAYRYYVSLVKHENEIMKKHQNLPTNTIIDKETFLQKVLQSEKINIITHPFGVFMSRTPNEYMIQYTFGDLGDVYGKSWRHFGVSGVDQIQKIIDTLKTNPNDRRMLCMAYNPDVVDKVALPPCHVMFQVYARELSNTERLDWLCQHSNGEYDEWKSCPTNVLDENNVPKYGLSLMWTQRSVDSFLGLPYNIASYSILTYMIAQVCNMIPDEVICSLGDTHIYMEHMDAVNEQLSNYPMKYDLPRLVLNPNITDINDFTLNDVKVENYKSYPTIKAKLLVG